MNRDTLHPDPFDGGSPADAGTATPARGLDDSIPDDASRRLGREVAAAGIPVRPAPTACECGGVWEGDRCGRCGSPFQAVPAPAAVPAIDVSAPDLGAVAGALIGRRDALLAEVKALVAQAERIGMDRVNAVLEAAGMDVHLGRSRCYVDISVPNVKAPAPREGTVPEHHRRMVRTWLLEHPELAGLDAVAMYGHVTLGAAGRGCTPALTFAQFDAALHAVRVELAGAMKGRA